MADKKKNKISIKNVVACGIGTALERLCSWF